MAAMAAVSNLAQANRLLAALPFPQRNALLADCALEELRPGTLPLSAGEAMAQAWFPVEGYVSLMLPLAEAPPLALGLVGREGWFNASLAWAAGDSAVDCRTLGAGRAFRIEAAALQQHLQQLPALRAVLQGYADVRHRQLAQQAACLKHHSVAQRLARWLLMTRDRAQASELFLTHDALAQLLGARRESVTQAARQLQLRGHISYSRGYMMLLDAEALEATACPCYGIDRHTYASWWSRVAAQD